MSLPDSNVGVENELAAQDADTKRLQALSANRLNEKQIEHNNLKIASENYNKMEERKIKLEDIKSKEVIAKTNKNKYDK